MQSKLFEYLFLTPLYWILELLRLLFLTGKAGAILHNAIYHALFSMAPKNTEHKRKYTMLTGELRSNPAILEWQRRAYTSCPAVVRHVLKNVFVRRFLVGTLHRLWLEKQGNAVPRMLMISLNTPEAGCNLKCEHCYATGHENTMIPLEILMRVLREQEQLGIYNVMLLGGEPFLYRHIWHILESFPKTSFYVATNGTHMDAEAVNRLSQMGNVFPMVSLEGFEAHTDAIRGNGTYQLVAAGMKRCKDAGLAYGVTATVTKQNMAEVTGRFFLEMLTQLRCCAISYSCYVPIGRDPHPEWQINYIESEQLDGMVDFIHANFPMFPTVGRNGTSRVNDCAAAKQFMHILPTGQVETCPFVQWAAPEFNVGQKTILEIMASPYFNYTRKLGDRGVTGLTPCHAPNLKTLQTDFSELGAKPTVH